MKNFLTISFLLTMSISAFANLVLSDPPIGSPFGTIINDPGGTEGVFAIEGCETSIMLSVVVANLDLYLPDPDANGNEALPLGIPPIIVEYSINGGPNEYITLSEYTFWKTEEGVNLYKSRFQTVSVDVTDVCAETNSYGFSFLPYSMRLLKTLNGEDPRNHIPYPACDYTGPDDIFSCQVFVHALEMCGAQGTSGTGLVIDDGGSSECDNDLLTTQNDYVILECLSCGDVDQGPGFDGGGDQGLSIDGSIDGSIDQRNEEGFHQETLNISANPNPFNNNLEISWSETTPVETLEIFDPTGKLIKRWESNQLNTLNTLNLDVHQFPKGLYFIKAKSMDLTKVIKVVKQ